MKQSTKDKVIGYGIVAAIASIIIGGVYIGKDQKIKPTEPIENVIIEDEIDTPKKPVVQRKKTTKRLSKKRHKVVKKKSKPRRKYVWKPKKKAPLKGYVYSPKKKVLPDIVSYPAHLEDYYIYDSKTGNFVWSEK